MDYLPKRRIILFGQPKSGKTRCLATVPKGSSLYLIDADRQAGELVSEWKRIHGNLKGLEIVPLQDVKDDSDAEQKRGFSEVRKALWNPPSGFDFYVVDSYTKIALLLTHALVGKGERHYNQYNNQQLSSAVNDFWFQFVNRVEYLEPSAWIFTLFHEKWQEVDDGTIVDPKAPKPRIVVPKCGTSAEVAIPGSCDFVWHVEKGRRIVSGKSQSVSIFRTTGTSTIMAASVGFTKQLETTEIADLATVLGKLNLPAAQKAKPKAKETTKAKKGTGRWQKSKQD